MTISTASVTTIIPTYNRLETLKQVLPSYLEQNCTKEIIIIDDFSTDNTQNYLESLSKSEPRIKYYRNSKNMGGPYSKNRATPFATGEYIFIGEDDLELTPNYFETLLVHLKNNSADIIAGRRIWLQNNETKDESLARADNAKGEPFNKNLLTTNCEVKLSKDTEIPLVDASMLIKRKVLNDISYDEFYRKTAWREETDFQLSAFQKGYKIVFCPHAVSYHLYKKRNTGGNHAHSLFDYELSVFRNNLHMSMKYWKFLQNSFGINYYFFIRFIYYRISRLILNESVKYKKRLL